MRSNYCTYSPKKGKEDSAIGVQRRVRRVRQVSDTDIVDCYQKDEELVPGDLFINLMRLSDRVSDTFSSKSNVM